MSLPSTYLRGILIHFSSAEILCSLTWELVISYSEHPGHEQVKIPDGGEAIFANEVYPTFSCSSIYFALQQLFLVWLTSHPQGISGCFSQRLSLPSFCNEWRSRHIQDNFYAWEMEGEFPFNVSYAKWSRNCYLLGGEKQTWSILD